MLTRDPQDLTTADAEAMTLEATTALPRAHQQRVAELAIDAMLASVPVEQRHKVDALGEMRSERERHARMGKAAFEAELAASRAKAPRESTED